VTRNARLLATFVVTTLAVLLVVEVAPANHSAKDHISLGPTGGNGVADVFFDAVSGDGSRVFFDTDERLTTQDTDSSFDVYERRGGTTTLISIGPAGGNGAFDVFFAAASADGTRVFFETDEQLHDDDNDSAFDVYERAGGTTTLMSGGSANVDVIFHAISKDGTRVFFETDEQLHGDDMDAQTDIYQHAGGTTTLISTAPGSGNGPFFAGFGGVSADGTKVVFETDEQLHDDDNDSAFDVYQRSGVTTTLLSTGPDGGNANIDASYRDVSADGTHVFFQTAEVLTAPEDADAQSDVYSRVGGTTTLISTGPNGGNGALAAAYEGTSADGTRVFFSTTESLITGPTGDSDARRDIYARDGAATELLSTGPGGGNGAFDADFMGASLDGANAYIRTEESLVATDSDSGCASGQGPQCRDIYENAGGTTTQVSVGSINGNGAFDASFATVSLDGERVFFETREPLVGTDMDGSVDVYERFLGSTTHISNGVTGGNGAFTAFMFSNGLSDDGRRAFFDTAESLMASDMDTFIDLYVADVAGFPRPKSASPASFSLVPAYTPCTAPNRTHGPPLAHPSCSPPAQVSGQATVGTPDGLGGAPNFTGNVRYTVLVGIPGPPEDSNVKVTSSLADVRCRPTGASCGGANSGGPADYAGEVRVAVSMRMTDRWNAVVAGGGTDAATVQDTSFEATAPCAQTASTSIGSSCTLNTSANALIPGLVKDTKRTIWALDRVRVYDGGPDQDADTTGNNTLFATQGVFIP
jgi:hypothetical protein